MPTGGKLISFNNKKHQCDQHAINKGERGKDKTRKQAKTKST